MSQSDILQELSFFPGRIQALQAIKRFSLYHRMVYRTDIEVHERRVALLLEALLPLMAQVFGRSLDATKALALALVHDDAEIITGDIQAGNKALMRESQLQEVTENERRAIEILDQRYPRTVAGFSYRSLLEEILECQTLESQYVKFFDKYDGFGSTLHEVYAGNTVPCEQVVNEYGCVPTPCEYYVGVLGEFPSAYPLIAPLQNTSHPLFAPPTLLDFRTIALQRQPPTPVTIREKTGYFHYDWWKETLLNRGGAEQLQLLTTPVE